MKNIWNVSMLTILGCLTVTASAKADNSATYCGVKISNTIAYVNRAPVGELLKLRRIYGADSDYVRSKICFESAAASYVILVIEKQDTADNMAFILGD